MAVDQAQGNRSKNVAPFDVNDPSTYPRPIHSVKPNMVCIDSHRFRIEYGVPNEVTKSFYDLFECDAKYEDIPKELLQYEVEVEGEDEDEDEDAVMDEANRKAQADGDESGDRQTILGC
jgi:hypothetical protein